MSTKGERFAGVTVALVTPFRNGDVDWDGLGRLVEWHVEQGTDCLAPVGTTGESPTLDHEEHERVIAAVAERAAGRIKVMAGTGSNSTKEALRLTRFAKRAGADGALMVGPYYNKPTQEGYYRHFAAVAELVTEEQVAESIVCGPDPERHLAAIRRYAEAGYDHVCIHQVGKDQKGFVTFYAEEILPRLESVTAAGSRKPSRGKRRK